MALSRTGAKRVILRTDHHHVVIPAKAGTQAAAWVPAFAGMTTTGYGSETGGQDCAPPPVIG